MKDLHEIKVEFDREYYKEIRKSKKIKKKDLATICGINLSTLTQLTQGKNKNPSASTVYKLALALDVPMEDLLKEI